MLERTGQQARPGVVFTDASKQNSSGQALSCHNTCWLCETCSRAQRRSCWQISVTCNKLQLGFLWQVGKAYRCGWIKQLLLIIQPTGGHIKLQSLLETDIFDNFQQWRHWCDADRLSFACEEHSNQAKYAIQNGDSGPVVSELTDL